MAEKVVPGKVRFANIRDINVSDPQSWSGSKAFITFDIEWAGDETLSYILDIVESNGINATFFCTHKTILLDRMRRNPKIELGIHPNFNFLMNGDFRYGKNIDEVIDLYMKICPEAVSVRSHCLTDNSLLTKAFTRRGLKFDCNTLIPVSAGIGLKPWLDCNKGLVKVPFMWEDDTHCMYGWEPGADKMLKKDGLKIFNFHPVMVLLNMEKMERYEGSKPFYTDHEKLKKNRYEGYGIENFLKELIAKGGSK